MWHVTARMAWHDRGWDGKVCKDPAGNTFCSGSHSLLSDRLARDKRVDKEVPFAPLDARLPEYLPPCFWTSAAFADQDTKVVHRHPFAQFKDTKAIEGSLPAGSIYTWPFRLSMTHQWPNPNGKYFPDLEQRVAKFRQRLTPGRSFIFYYLNYDNPISADEYKYALVGCARLADSALAGSFDFDDDELEELRSGDGMQNFPTLNWALRLTHGGAASCARLPYHAYLAHIAEHPEDERKLEQIRVLVEEPGLVSGFKYVSEQVNDDHAIVLLYKMKRALSLAREHGIADVEADLAVVDTFIRECWAARGLYPGLGSVMTALSHLADGEPGIEGNDGQKLVDAYRQAMPDGDLLDAVFELIKSSTPLPASIAAHEKTLKRLRRAYKDNKNLDPALRKLSLFSLTPRQVGRILYRHFRDPSTFGSTDIRWADVVKNPYLLAESYVPATSWASEEQKDLDREQRTDRPIDYASIDIGMFPDTEYLEPRDDLQDLTVLGPERLRAFAIEALRENEARGNSFATVKYLTEHAAEHPLFYREKLAVTEDHLRDDDRLAYFRERLHVAEDQGELYFYRKETWQAEQIVKEFVLERLTLPDHKVELSWLPAFLDSEAAAIGERINGFDGVGFVRERSRLLNDALARSFYCLTGRPGSGKSQAVNELLRRLQDAGETSLVLAPTGKAALRLNRTKPADAAWEAQTIDRWIFRSGLQDWLEEGAGLRSMTKSTAYEPVTNVVIDEMSMINLFQLALLFQAIRVHQPKGLKRVILVGDENQLPPIGCGKPLQDIINHLRSDPELEDRHLIRLKTNCRQEGDEVVLEAAHLFAGKNRYHTELADQLIAGGKVSGHLNVRYWSTAAELYDAVAEFINAALDDVPDRAKLTAEQAFNVLMGLYPTGHVPDYNARALELERVQLLSPYRGGASGAIGLSNFVRSEYRADTLGAQDGFKSGFLHSDKLVRVSNLYVRNPKTRQRELRLSNGSIGVLCGSRKGWRGFFPEADRPIKWRTGDTEDYELAYGLTVHKAQGSEFKEVLVVIPERRALLSRELIYTAMTRSQTRLTLLVQRSPRANPLNVARARSVLEERNSSTFTAPFQTIGRFEPEGGTMVQSKIEFMIYRELMAARAEGRLDFGYEQPIELPFDGKLTKVRPDFVIRCGGNTYYWEHLGMLDRQDYERDWRSRLAAYKAAGLAENLVTTDDLAGVRAGQIALVINDLIAGTPAGRADLGYSRHHYTL